MTYKNGVVSCPLCSSLVIVSIVDYGLKDDGSLLGIYGIS
jgi:hypothetical protein